MTEQELADAIRRWFQAGGSHDRIIEIADTMYATKAEAEAEQTITDQLNARVMKQFKNVLTPEQCEAILNKKD
jgi:molybdopterin-guanine dinucleotide biosynthesis protein A